MTYVLLGAVFVIGVAALWFTWRAGIGPEGATPGQATSLERDGETDGFESDWSKYRDRPAGRDDGPGWDS